MIEISIVFFLQDEDLDIALSIYIRDYDPFTDTDIGGLGVAPVDLTRLSPNKTIDRWIQIKGGRGQLRIAGLLKGDEISLCKRLEAIAKARRKKAVQELRKVEKIDHLPSWKSAGRGAALGLIDEPPSKKLRFAPKRDRGDGSGMAERIEEQEEPSEEPKEMEEQGETTEEQIAEGTIEEEIGEEEEGGDEGVDEGVDEGYERVFQKEEAYDYADKEELSNEDQYEEESEESEKDEEDVLYKEETGSYQGHYGEEPLEVGEETDSARQDITAHTRGHFDDSGPFSKQFGQSDSQFDHFGDEITKRSLADLAAERQEADYRRVEGQIKQTPSDVDRSKGTVVPMLFDDRPSQHILPRSTTRRTDESLLTSSSSESLSSSESSESEYSRASDRTHQQPGGGLYSQPPSVSSRSQEPSMKMQTTTAKNFPPSERIKPPATYPKEAQLRGEQNEFRSMASLKGSRKGFGEQQSPMFTEKPSTGRVHRVSVDGMMDDNTTGWSSEQAFNQRPSSDLAPMLPEEMIRGSRRISGIEDESEVVRPTRRVSVFPIPETDLFVRRKDLTESEKDVTTRLAAIFPEVERTTIERIVRESNPQQRDLTPIEQQRNFDAALRIMADEINGRNGQVSYTYSFQLLFRTSESRRPKSKSLIGSKGSTQ